MNVIAAYTKPVPLGYHAMCRFAQNAKPWPIMDGDKPKVFPDHATALIAAQQHVIEHINGTYRRDGETLPTAKSEAEKQFGAIFMKGRVIPIERKERVKA